MRRSRTLAVLAVLGLMVLGSGQAMAATDKTPPVLKTPLTADFQVGTSISAESDYSWCGDVGEFADVPETFTFSGSDDSGYVRYTVGQYESDEPLDIIERNSTVTTINSVTTNYDNDCGGDGTLGSWSVTAKDKAGNATNHTVGGFFQLLQDDNTALTYAGPWAVSHCQCWSGLTTHDTSTAGSSVSLSVPSGTHHVAVTMAVGPPQGSAQVVVDGVVKATVNTYATTKSPRVIVWDSNVSTTQSHIITIVNLATPGHPRIDVDAFLTD